MQLSIIIVNYNVRFFLEQCLYSVQKAMEGLDAELIVVDNHSVDGSLEYLMPLFPQVRFISNQQNLGFAKANNQAIPLCKGEYLLFLNPDTLVPEDSLHKCLAFIRSDAKTGALGVRMLDGRGRFLPESKRAFPSPGASLFKLTGLAGWFPKSALFNSYALGNLNEHRNHTVDVLAGAFMMVRKELLLQLNGFDEDYFLYGEDIDLSYRIQKAGFTNRYFSETSIIHFKGESSAGTSLNRVEYFYRAMLVFVDKHYRLGSAKIFSTFIRVAIAVRGIISALNKIIKPVMLPLMDGAMVFLSLQVVRMSWIQLIRSGKDFGVAFIPYALPLFALLFVVAAAGVGLYDKIYKTSKTLVSIAFAAVSMLAVYSLLPEQLRFSRGVMTGGGLLGCLLILLLRWFLLKRSHQFFGQEAGTAGQTVIVSNEEEYRVMMHLLTKAMLDKKILGRVSLHKNETDTLCDLDGLSFSAKHLSVTEVIFCVGTLSLKEIVARTEQLSVNGIRFLFHVKGSKSMVGSDTLAAGAKTITAYIEYRITQPYQQRMKRLTDMVISIFFLLSSPIHLILHKKGICLIQNAWSVLLNKQTWIGYASNATSLPYIKSAVVSHMGSKTGFPETVLEKADRLYAKEYDWWPDLQLVFQYYQQLG